MSSDPDTPATIDGIVDALAALTDRVRALEELAKPKASAPFSFGDDGLLYVSPAVIPKVRAAEQAIADGTAKPAPSASKLYDEATRITTEPATNLLARIDALETSVASLQAMVAVLTGSVRVMESELAMLQMSVSALSSAVGHISASESGLDCRLVTLESQLAVLQAGVDGLEAITNERRGRRS